MIGRGGEEPMPSRALVGRRAQRIVASAAVALLAALASATAGAQAITIDTLDVQQTVDGFGTCLSGTEAQSDWWRTLYFDDLRASMVRFDIVPRFKAPYSDYLYNCPWYHNNPPLP